MKLTVVRPPGSDLNTAGFPYRNQSPIHSQQQKFSFTTGGGNDIFLTAFHQQCITISKFPNNKPQSRGWMSARSARKVWPHPIPDSSQRSTPYACLTEAIILQVINGVRKKWICHFLQSINEKLTISTNPSNQENLHIHENATTGPIKEAYTSQFRFVSDRFPL